MIRYNFILKNHLLIILAVTIFVLLFTGQIEYQLPQYKASDLTKYIAMAKSSPELNTNIIKPFVYRILAPWIVGLMPFSIQTNFLLLNIVSLILLSFVFYFALLEFKLLPNVALALTIAFQMNRYFFQFLSWNYFQLCDTIALTVLFLSFILIKRKKWSALFLILPVSILVKEYALIILPMGLYYFLIHKKSKKDFLLFAIISFFTVAVYGSVRMVLNVNQGADLLTQYTTKEFYYPRIMLFLKKYVASFIPFGLLPIVFWKELISFFKKNGFLFVYTITVIVISYFGEAERMMAPLAIVYFMFVGNLIEKTFDIKDRFQENRIFFTIIIISFLSSFYHLWGIVQFPNKYWSIASTILFSIIIAILFYKKKIKNLAINQN